MKFVLLFGPQAVGKMTVGQELTRITSLKLFHNHMTIDLFAPLFGFTPEMWRLCHLVRTETFKTFAGSGQYGIIFTKVWAFNHAEDWSFVNRVCNIFCAVGATVYFVELEADTAVRLKRNRTPNRLAEKPTKRNIAKSEQNLLESAEYDRLNSRPGEIRARNYLRINNTTISAEQVATMIKEHFNL